MLNSDALHSLIASPMQAERSSADGLGKRRARQCEDNEAGNCNHFVAKRNH